MKYQVVYVRTASGRELFNNRELRRTVEQLDVLAQDLFVAGGKPRRSYVPTAEMMIWKATETNSKALLVAIAV
jgi:hypothetical protein